VKNELSPKAQATSSEANIKRKDKQEKKKEYLNLNGYENLNHIIDYLIKKNAL